MARNRSEMDGAAFEALLAALGAERERASSEYERLRSRLMDFFSLHDAPAPEDLADEALNRIARRLREGETIRDIPKYLAGIARLLLREEWSRAQREQTNRRRAELAPNRNGDGNLMIEALESCLEDLPAESRGLICQYYDVDGNDRVRARAEMARNLGISVNALRNRALRIRGQLEQCVKKSLEEQDKRGINFTNKQKD